MQKSGRGVPFCVEPPKIRRIAPRLVPKKFVTSAQNGDTTVSNSDKRIYLPKTATLPEGGVADSRPTDHDHEIEVTIILKPPRLDDDHPVASLREKPPHERSPLSRKNLGEIYGPEDEHVEQVRAFAETHDLSVVRISREKHDMVLKGTVGAMNKAFGVELHDVEGEHRSYRAHRDDITVPKDLEDIVIGVLGLNTVPLARSFAGMGGGIPGPFTPDQLAQHYDYPSTDGSGFRLAILSFGDCGYHQSDIDGYFNYLGMTPPTLNDISVNSVTNNPLPYPRLVEMTNFYKYGTPPATPFTPYELTQGFRTLEVTLDIEIAGAIANGATIDVYFAADDEVGWYDAIHAALGLDGSGAALPAAISISWGSSESEFGESRMNAIQPALEKAELMHVTVCCSSGNYGSVNGSNPMPLMANVNYPASSNHVLACGGTMLDCDPGTSQLVESVWNQITPPWHHASGGGVSGYFGLPTYQESAGVPSHGQLNGKAWLSDDVQASNLFRRALWRRFWRVDFCGRGVPDVAAYAALQGGYSIFIGGQTFNSGGTSAATPMWAGLVARLSEALGQRVGWLNEFIYLPSFGVAFRDIVSGDNKIVDNGSAYFEGAPQWEACCGLGVPDGTALLHCLQTALATGLSDSGNSAQSQQSAA